jgi:hypothetical protein
MQAQYEQELLTMLRSTTLRLYSSFVENLFFPTQKPAAGSRFSCPVLAIPYEIVHFVHH